ncbi:MAG: hypothetical protein JWM70_13 [Microbacteriaceae bacterium]|jgi:hypothetical protein|nr:hypothetical protein [Microbacteriaceae bacterium]
MSIIAHSVGPRHRPGQARRLVSRWWFWTILAAVVLILACVALVGTRGLQVKSHLDAAQAQVGQLKSQVAAQKFSGLNVTLTKIQTHSAAALELTNDPIWRMAESVPVLGQNFTAVRELAGVTDEVVNKAITPLVSVAATLDPASFAPVNGAISLKPFTDAIPAVAQANTELGVATKAVNRIDTGGTISQLGAAKVKLAGLLASVVPVMKTANDILPLIPPLMGADAPRHYVVMFRNNAESRALGGTALSFALVTVDNGQIKLTSTVPAGGGNFAHYRSPVIPVPDGVEELDDGTFGTFIANATVRPDFASAGKITYQMWKQQFGEGVDGVLSIDPVALSYILRATTPIPLASGGSLTGDTLVPLLLNDVYQRYSTKNIAVDNAAQDAVYGEAVASTFARLSSGPLDSKVLMAAVVQGATERRLQFWSAHADEQAQLVATGFDGGLPKSDKTTDRVGVYFQDNVGSKLNFYLYQTVRLGQAMCRADGRETYRVGADLASTVPANAAKSLSVSILGNWKLEKLKPGQQRMYVMVYAPPGSQITGATVNGVPVALRSLHDEAYPVAKVTVIVNPGQTLNVSVDITAAKPGKKVLDAQVTPMVHNTPIVKNDPPLDCATVPVK